MTQPSLSLVLLLPVAGALTVALFPRNRESAMRVAAEVAFAATLVAALPLLWIVNVGPGGEPFQLVERYAIGMLPFEYLVGVDGFSALLVVVTAVSGCIAAAAVRLAAVAPVRGLYLCLLSLQALTLASFITLDALLFLLCAEAAALPMYLLARNSDGVTRPAGSYPYPAVTLAAAALMACAVLALQCSARANGAGVNFDLTQLRTLAVPPAAQSWIFAAFCLAVLLKLADVVIHSQTTARRALPVAAAVFALTAVTLKVPVYALIRIGLPALPEAALALAPVAASAALAFVFATCWLAFRQNAWAPLLVVAAAGQAAFTLFALLTLNPTGVTGSLVQQIDHSFAIAALLLVAAALAARPAGDVPSPVGSPSAMPRLAVVVLLLVLLAAGVPVPGGEWQMLEGAWRRGGTWAFAGAGGDVAALAALTAFYRRALRHGDTSTVRLDLSAREMLTVAPLLAVVLVTAVHPDPLVARVTPTANRVVLRVSPEFAAECDTSLTPEIVAATPGGQFLAAAPCAPDGTPLPSEPVAR